MTNNEHLEGNEQSELFLSRLLLNLRERAVRRDLADCHQMHQRMLSLFGRARAETARAELGVLYRVEMEAQTGAPVVLVQSKERPEWSRLPAQYLRQDAGASSACKSIADKYAAIDVWMHLRFRLRANPTRKVETKTLADGKRRNGKRVEIRDELEQLEWLARKGAQHGFSVRGVRTINENKSIGNRFSPHTTSIAGESEPLPDEVVDKRERPLRLTFASVLFEGELMVTDKEMFKEALKRGIGSGKSYGFGLLSISR